MPFPRFLPSRSLDRSTDRRSFLADTDVVTPVRLNIPLGSFGLNDGRGDQVFVRVAQVSDTIWSRARGIDGTTAARARAFQRQTDRAVREAAARRSGRSGTKGWASGHSGGHSACSEDLRSS